MLAVVQQEEQQEDQPRSVVAAASLSWWCPHVAVMKLHICVLLLQVIRGCWQLDGQHK